MEEKLGKGLREFYTDKELKARFGTVNPTRAQRTNEFEFLWFNYGEANELNTTDLDVTSEQISTERKKLGTFNVITKGKRLRFRNKEDMVYFKLKYLK